jgi:mycofactocin precursor
MVGISFTGTLAVDSKHTWENRKSQGKITCINCAIDGMLDRQMRIIAVARRGNLMDTTSFPTDESTTTAETPAEPSPVLEADIEQADPLAPENSPEDSLLEDEIEDELIIEDFTIDGICGVY